MSMKTLGVNDAPAGGNVAHLEYLSNKSKVWINRMKNGHLPSHIAWMAYKLQLWAGLRYGIGTMTNDIEEAEGLFKEQEQGLLNILGIAKNVKRELRRLQPTLGGFGLFNLPMEQLVGRISLMMQHYHTPSNLSRKPDVSLNYQQLQVGTNKKPTSPRLRQMGALSNIQLDENVVEIAKISCSRSIHEIRRNPISQRE
jgi:hypothetical protein